MLLNLGSDNFCKMTQTRERGRPREWVLDEEIVEIHKLLIKLKTQHPKGYWSAIKDMLKATLAQTGRSGLLSKLDKLWGLVRQVIPLPPECICGNREYSYTYRKDANGHWEVFARCTNRKCLYMRRFLPSASYSWSRPKSIIRELQRTPTFYELDGQKVEGEK